MPFAMLRGDTLNIDVSFTRDNSPVDITSSTIYFTAKRNIGDTDAQALIVKTSSSGIVIVDAANGLAQIQIEPSDTALIVDDVTLIFDVQLNESSGRVSSVKDSLKIRQDVTRSH